jgi:hypothetical protein
MRIVELLGIIADVSGKIKKKSSAGHGQGSLVQALVY